MLDALPKRVMSPSRAGILLAASVAAVLAIACGGTTTGTTGTPNEMCPAGATYCHSCGGGGFCASACPGFACPGVEAGIPIPIEAGDATGDASGGVGDAGGCPGGMPFFCTDCNGGGFCVAGGRPAIQCPIPGDSGGGTNSITCTADGGTTALPSFPDDPSVRHSVSGTNGTFVDTCDSSGNLVDYSCATLSACGPGPNPECTRYETGAVKSTNIDCVGTCVNGQCDGRCPMIGQQVTFTGSVSGGVIPVTNNGDGRRYSCTVAYQNSAYSFNCTSGPHAGLQMTIVSLGLGGDWCTGKQWGSFGASVDGVSPAGVEVCAYTCDIVP